MASRGVLKPRPTFLYHRWPPLPGVLRTGFLKPPLMPSCFWYAFSVCGEDAGLLVTHQMCAAAGRGLLQVHRGAFTAAEHRIGRGCTSESPCLLGIRQRH